MVDIILTMVIVAVLGGATIAWLVYSQRKSSAHRQADLERVQRWFQPALDAGETLQPGSTAEVFAVGRAEF